MGSIGQINDSQPKSQISDTSRRRYRSLFMNSLWISILQLAGPATIIILSFITFNTAWIPHEGEIKSVRRFTHFRMKSVRNPEWNEYSKKIFLLHMDGSLLYRVFVRKRSGTWVNIRQSTILTGEYYWAFSKKYRKFQKLLQWMDFNMWGVNVGSFSCQVQCWGQCTNQLTWKIME